MENPFEIIIQRLNAIESLLRSDKVIERVVETKEVMTVAELSEYLSISKSAIYKMTSSNVLPHYKPTGKLLYFKKAEIVEWVLKDRIKTVDEIRIEADNHLRKLGRQRLK